MYDKETNIYTCGRCGLKGLRSIHPTEQDIADYPELWEIRDVCTACANHLRLGDFDPLEI